MPFIYAMEIRQKILGLLKKVESFSLKILSNNFLSSSKKGMIFMPFNSNVVVNLYDKVFSRNKVFAKRLLSLLLFLEILLHFIFPPKAKTM